MIKNELEMCQIWFYQIRLFMCRIFQAYNKRSKMSPLLFFYDSVEMFIHLWCGGDWIKVMSPLS